MNRAMDDKNSCVNGASACTTQVAFVGKIQSYKQRSDSSTKNRSSRCAKSFFTIRGKSEGNERSRTGKDENGSGSEIERQCLTDLALRGGNNIIATILDQIGEMLVITQILSRKVIDGMNPYWLESVRDLRHDKSDDERANANNNDLKSEQQQHQEQDACTPPPPPPPFRLVPTSSLAYAFTAASSQIAAMNDWVATAITGASDKDHLLRRVYNGMDTLKRLLEQLQVADVLFESDLIKEIKVIFNQDCKTASNGSKKQRSGTAGRSTSGLKGENGSSRLYLLKQIQTRCTTLSTVQIA
ncbi:homeobox and zinc-finger domain-containing protein [Plasmopara halstedii]|uniref:Homeobox and zinc-finger domain-containing protein n=1 Tax=Plasmopara halstedii TaxID=4781 RepID=A0A0P1AEJ6_PLAHL|nr:homeobox and zinc-finger domain-containing protein [Plasmopara halstedii]CEG38806.1 homeobox and zinc-finger domain-containing protein [Plasmopara halstedii]|eukprot:XP_024575175.1 homeobox and zinc-finger domain-containing protein [Plasmopara halstedii]